MKRLKEEKELLDHFKKIWQSSYIGSPSNFYGWRGISSKITALIRAVRKDERKRREDER